MTKPERYVIAGPDEAGKSALVTMAEIAQPSHYCVSTSLCGNVLHQRTSIHDSSTDDLRDGNFVAWSSHDERHRQLFVHPCNSELPIAILRSRFLSENPTRTLLMAHVSSWVGAFRPMPSVISLRPIILTIFTATKSISCESKNVRPVLN